MILILLFLLKWFIHDTENTTKALNIKIKDLFPVGDREGGEVEIDLTLEALRKEVQKFRFHLAIKRYQDILAGLSQREDDAKD